MPLPPEVSSCGVGLGGGVARIKDSVEVDSLFIHPLPPTSTAPLTSPVGECTAITFLQMTTRLIWNQLCRVIVWMKYFHVI